MIRKRIVVDVLTHRYNAVRGHRTGYNNSAVQGYLRQRGNKEKKQKKNTIHKITETNRIPDKIKG